MGKQQVTKEPKPTCKNASHTSTSTLTIKTVHAGKLVSDIHVLIHTYLAEALIDFDHLIYKVVW